MEQMKKKVEKKSPLKGKPLRHAGQSVQQKIDDLSMLDVGPYIALAVLMVFFALFEWYQYVRDTPPQPKVVTLASILVISFCIYKVIQTRRKIDKLKLGRDGERDVAEHLDGLREDGCVVFHDIIADNFNLDHVIISEKGIFAVETKTLRKRRNAKIIYDGSDINADGIKMTPDPVEQAQANARWLRNVLKESTGKNFPVKPVIVFPGWFVEFKGRPNPSNAWVLNPKGLSAFIRREPSVISSTDKHLAVYHLSRHIKMNY